MNSIQTTPISKGNCKEKKGERYTERLLSAQGEEGVDQKQLFSSEKANSDKLIEQNRVPFAGTCLFRKGETGRS